MENNNNEQPVEQSKVVTGFLKAVDEAVEAVEQTIVKPKLTIAERKVKVQLMLESGAKASDVMKELGVSSTYVYKLVKAKKAESAPKSD